MYNKKYEVQQEIQSITRNMKYSKKYRIARDMPKLKLWAEATNKSFELQTKAVS
jgi:hypothetical protein